MYSRIPIVALRWRAGAPRLPIRTFGSTTCLELKESGTRTPEELEREKHDSLRKQDKGEGHWKEGLASDGETGVKADKQADDVQDHGEHMKELQQEGKKKGEQGEL